MDLFMFTLKLENIPKVLYSLSFTAGNIHSAENGSLRGVLTNLSCFRHWLFGGILVDIYHCILGQNITILSSALTLVMSVST